MKKQIVSFLAVIALVSCGQDNKFTINGSTNEMANGVEVYLQKQDTLTGAFVSLDTVAFDNNGFKFEGEVIDPSISFIEIQGTNGKFPFVLENGKIAIKINKDTIQKSVVEGTISNDHLTAYGKEAEVIQNKIKDFQDANMQKWQDAVTANDTITRNELIAKNKEIQDGFLVLTKEHIEKNPKSYLSLLFISQLLYHPEADADQLTKSFNALADNLKNSAEGKKLVKEIAKLAESKKKANNPLQ